MSNNPHIQKVVQVAEEAAPPLHVPIMLGNEIIIVHQQDVRNTIDTRYLAYSRLGPNGEIIPLIVPNLGQNVVGLSGVITGIVPCQAISSPATQNSSLPTGAAFTNLQDLVNHFQQRNQLAGHQLNIFNKNYVWESPVAAIQQMDCSNTSKQLPVTNNVGTSTCEFKETHHMATQYSRCYIDKQCEANIITPDVNKVEKKEEPQQKKDATTCTSSCEECKTKSNLTLHSSSDDDVEEEEETKNSKEKTKNCKGKPKCYGYKNQENNNQRKKNLKTRFICD